MKIFKFSTHYFQLYTCTCVYIYLSNISSGGKRRKTFQFYLLFQHIQLQQLFRAEKTFTFFNFFLFFILFFIVFFILFFFGKNGKGKEKLWGKWCMVLKAPYEKEKTNVSEMKTKEKFSVCCNSRVGNRWNACGCLFITQQ